MTRRGLRLASGLVLFVYITGHFVNHALGLVSLAVAEQGLHIAVDVWQSAPGTLLLYGAVVIHIGLAFTAIYQHRTLRLPVLEWLRIAAGLSIPTLLIGHAVDTRLALEVYGHPTDYAHIVWTLWHSGREGRQIALLVPGWLHGCLGLSFALAGRAWYPRWRTALFGAVLLLPVLAVLGFFAMLKEVTVLAQDPAWVTTTIGPSAGVQHGPLLLVRNGLLAFYYSAIAAIFIARVVRSVVETRRGSLVSIGYPDRFTKVPRGWTVLEASRAHRIAHVSKCGGRARCSTCRVRVVSGRENCPPPNDAERLTLARIRASEGTRLACQLRPVGDIAVVPLVTAAAPLKREFSRATVERELVAMLVDLHWESAPRSPLPHDLLHALERFGQAVGDMARACGGEPVQFTGDRVLVLFGLDATAGAEPSRQALRAAAQLTLRLDELRAQFRDELGCESEHFIGLHFGAAVVGEAGDRSRPTLIAAGDAIDVAGELVVAQRLTTSRDGQRSSLRIGVSREALMAARCDSPTMDWQALGLRSGKRVEFVWLDSFQAAACAQPSPDSSL